MEVAVAEAGTLHGANEEQFVNFPWKQLRGRPQLGPAAVDGRTADCSAIGAIRFTTTPKCRHFGHARRPRSAVAWRRSSTVPTTIAGEQLGFSVSSSRRRSGGGQCCSTPRADGCPARITRIRGPANPSLNYECGLLIEGFDSPAHVHDDLQQALLWQVDRGMGIRKVQDMYAFWGHIDMVPKLDRSCASSATRPSSGSTSKSGP